MGVECEPCNRFFREPEHYYTHLANSFRHHYCEPCDRHFVSESAKQAHLDYSSNHRSSPNYYRICRWCQTEVDDFDHHNEETHEICPVCDRWFDHQDDLEEHFAEDHEDIYCIDCSKLFQNPNNLRMHMMSSKHTTKNIECCHIDCTATFTTMAAFISHLESGSCRSGMGTEELEEEFSKLDQEGLFVERKLLKPVLKYVIPDSYNNYRCPLCHVPKVFRNPHQLQQHLSSPKHKNRGSRPFICPSNRCSRARFNSLSGLLYHRERGDCERAHNRKLNNLCHQLFSDIKKAALKREMEAIYKKFESFLRI